MAQAIRSFKSRSSGVFSIIGTTSVSSYLFVHLPAKMEENFLKEAMTDGFIVQNPFASMTPQRETESATLDLQDGQRADMSEASGGALESSGDFTASTAAPSDSSGPRLHPTTAANTTSPLPGQEEGSGEASGQSDFGLSGSGSGSDQFFEETATTTSTTTTSTTTTSVRAVSTTEILSTAETLSTTHVPGTIQGLSSTTQSPSSTTTGATDVNVPNVAPETDSPPQSTTTTSTATTTSTTTDPILLRQGRILPNKVESTTAPPTTTTTVAAAVVVNNQQKILGSTDTKPGAAASSSEQQQQQEHEEHEEQEMTEFLPREERGGAEYTVVPLSELCEKESLS
ncbi:hypothetical protein CRUP_000370 [Coryphaenoides rupestris]|nr:hypothetical protein CRUP_000370 [Coryphaenoides rupestris]